VNRWGRQVTHVCIVYTSKGIPVHSSLLLPVQLQYLILCSANSMSNLLKFIVSGHRVLLPWHDNIAICTHWSVFTVVTYNAVIIRKHAASEIHKTESKSQFINFINVDKTDKVVLWTILHELWEIWSFIKQYNIPYNNRTNIQFIQFMCIKHN